MKNEQTLQKSDTYAHFYVRFMCALCVYKKKSPAGWTVQYEGLLPHGAKSINGCPTLIIQIKLLCK